MIAIIPQTEIGKAIFELFALSILAGLARLFLLEKTLSGGWKQFFGGIVFGCLTGYLCYSMNQRHAYYEYCGKVWRFWTVVSAIFGKEILFVFKTAIIDSLPVIKTFFIKQAKKIANAIEAYKKTNDE